jgi:hypothetical protein
MHKLLVLVVLVVLVLASALAWLVLTPKDSRGGAVGSAHGSEAAAEPDGAAPGGLEADVELAQAEARPEAELSEAERRRADSKDFDPALALRVRGSVELPRDLPADERVRVVADEPGAHGSESSAGAPHDLAEVEVDSLGRFEIGIPRDRDVMLVLKARYLRSAQTFRVEPGAELEAPHFATQLGAWVTGRLVPPEGVAIPEAEREDLRVTWSPGELSDFTRMGGPGRVVAERRESRVDAELAFEFTGVGTEYEGDLRVAPKSLAAHKSARFTPRAGEHVVLDLRLESGGTLAGRVVDESGAGVADAELEVSTDPVMMGFGGFEVREGKSDGDGRFTLAHVLPGSLIVRAECEGRLEGREELVLAPGETRGDLVLTLSSGNAIAGRVLWPDGTPVVDVEVEAEFDVANLGGMGAFNAMRGPRGEDDSDATGAFRVTGLGKGPFTVTVETKRDGATWQARRDAVAPQTLDLELVLAETLAIAGRVVDDTGAPVPAFSVRAAEKTSGMFPGVGGAQASGEFEDAEGRFRLEGLSERTWIVRAGGEGYGQGVALELTLPGGADVEHTLSLPRAAAVSGLVIGPDGRPVGGAEVALQLGLANLVDMGREGARPTTQSAADGTFLLEGLTPGALSLVASAEGFAPSEPVPVEPAPAETQGDVTLALRMGGRILGEIYDKAGERLAGAPILAQNPANFSGQRWTSSDGNGEFVLEHLAPGTWQVMTMPGRSSIDSMSGDDEGTDFGEFFSEMKFQMAEVVEGQDAHVVLGGRPADPVRVRGRVLAGGVPQAGALVNFMADGGTAEGTGAFKITTSRKDGGYELELDGPGGYMVQVQQLVGASGQQQSVQLHFELPDEREIDLDLPLPVGSITGLVRGPDGQPLGGARVTLSIEGGVSNLTFGGGQYAEIATDADGTYELVWLRAGKYTVSAGGPLMGGMFGGADDAPARAVRSGVRVGDGDRVDGIDFRLKAPGRLVGTVVDGAGKPVADAAVFVRDENGNLLERISMAATDASGRFTYAGIGAGGYKVHARSTSQVSAEAAVSVREGQDSALELVVAPGAVLLITLADEAGEPVDCSVTVTDEDGRQVNGNWSMADLMALFQSGSFTSKEQRVGPVAPGKYTIHAETSDGLSATKRVTVNDQAERKVNLRLKE